jgi:hypothetical protein
MSFFSSLQTAPSPDATCRFARTPRTATRRIPSFPNCGRLCCLAQWVSTSRRATWLAACLPFAPKKTFCQFGTRTTRPTQTFAFKSVKNSSRFSLSMTTALSSTRTTNHPCVISRLSATLAPTCSQSRRRLPHQQGPLSQPCHRLPRLVSRRQRRQQRAPLSTHLVGRQTSRQVSVSGTVAGK